MNFLPYDTTTSMYYVKSTNCFYLLLVTTNDSKAREDEVLPLLHNIMIFIYLFIFNHEIYVQTSIPTTKTHGRIRSACLL